MLQRLTDKIELQLNMFQYFYATFVAVILFDFGNSLNTTHYITPSYTCGQGGCFQNNCPQTHYLHNGMCYLKTENIQTILPQPCQVGTPCPAPIDQQPCAVGASTCLTTNSVVTHPYPPTVQCPPQPCQACPPCPAPVTQQPCTVGASTCLTTNSVVTHPYPPMVQCPPQPCQACPPCPAPVIQQPCAVGTSSCSTLINVILPTTKPEGKKEKKPIECPRGTILINDYCHLVYCGRGIYRDGRCIQTICPDGTIWTGTKCELPKVEVQNTAINMTNIINTIINQTDISRGLNFTNNFAIHIPESPITDTQSKCCVVVPPHTCKMMIGRWSCKTRRYRKCGPMCTHPYIYLNPPTVVQPPQYDDYDDCGNDCKPFYPDCSGCGQMNRQYCSTYCRTSVCQTRQCYSMDLQGYCESYPGSIGCRSVDGCMDDWCDNL